MAAARGATDATGKMVLCVGTTSVVVYMDENGNPTQAPHFCPDCTLTVLDTTGPVQGLSHLGLVTTPFVSIAYVAVEPEVLPHVYLSRAPPELT